MTDKHFGMEKLFHRGIFLPAVILASLFLAACSQEDFGDLYPKSEGIVFMSSVEGQDDLGTRATMYNISSEFYKCDFHIRIEGINRSGEERSKAGVYEIPSGFSGTLTEKTDADALNWFSRDQEHRFWGWTMPHDPSYRTTDSDLTEGIKIEFADTRIDELSGNNFKSGSWANGLILEQMLGGRSGPYTYDRDGMYVPLDFRHMVSKIMVRSFTISNNRGGTGSSIQKGEITIFGLPKEGTFHINPEDENGNPAYPYITMPEDWDYDQTEGQTFVISNYARGYKWEGSSWNSSNTEPKDAWYICPEVDLSKLSFMIQIYKSQGGEWILDETYGQNGAFYGDFSGITFTREGNNYDSPEGGDQTVLHAGEYLFLNINLQQNGGASAHGNILSWSKPSQDVTGNAHVNPGFYTLSDVKNLSDVMQNGTAEEKENLYYMTGNGKDTGSDPEGEYPDYEELYGEELKIFELMDDVGSEASHDANRTIEKGVKVEDLYVDDGYILEGNGHTLNCYNMTTLKVGHVRNIYLRLYYRNNITNVYYQYIIYIDNWGNVWIVDPVTFEETPTQYNINDPDKNPVTLDLATGRVY